MDLPEPRYRPDWPSRILAVCSLLVVLLVAWYVFTGRQSAITRDDLQDQFQVAVQAEADRQRELTDEKLAQWQTAAVASLQDQFGRVAQQHVQQLVTAQQQSLDQVVTEHQARLQQLGDELRQELAASSADAPPARHAAHLVFRPVSDNEHRVIVENPSELPVQIDSITFYPRQVLGADEVKMKDRGALASPADRQILFTGQDNQSPDPQKQGVYQQQLTPLWSITPGEALVLELAIENDEHLGYVLVGDLQLSSDGQEVLPVRTIAVPFVPGAGGGRRETGDG